MPSETVTVPVGAPTPKAATVGRELNVRAVLTGRIIQRGDNLIISAELTDRKSGAKGYWRKQIELYETGQRSWTLTRVAPFCARLGEADSDSDSI